MVLPSPGVTGDRSQLNSDLYIDKIEPVSFKENETKRVQDTIVW